MVRGDTRLLAAAFTDRLHEPYRPSPLLDAVRADLPPGAVGATLSGSGPTVIVWAEEPQVCAADLERRFPDERVLMLTVSSEGAG
jgi:homoserine kinase